jgi:two-component system, OmpR family, KDP operon response regulator KdpE
MTSGAKVLIVEDDTHIRRLLRAALLRAEHHVLEAASAREGLSLLDIERPEVVLLDLGLPDRDGLELIQLIRARSRAPIIVISAREQSEEKVAALDLGADDYLIKPFDTEELLARVRTALRHRRVEEGEAPRLAIGALMIDLDHRRVERDGIEVHLSRKEYGVLAELARRPDRVISHGQLLRAVWGPAQEDKVEYLRIAVRALRQKLEEDAADPRIIINELGVGYRLRTEGRSGPAASV